MTLSPAELEAIFGPDSRGDDAETRASTSSRQFVRSQVQIALATERSTGHRLTALEVLQDYGIEVLRGLAAEGSVALVTDPAEPAATLRDGRNALNLTVDDVARRTGLPRASIETAETQGSVSPIRDLERMAQALALDERQLGRVAGARRDAELGVRLRDIAQGVGDARRFSPADVLALAEAAWVVARQSDLDRAGARAAEIVKPSDDYDYPAYERGYDLARRTREVLGLGEEEPIESLKTLLEDTLGIPVIQQAMNARFAGATVANGSSRGIVVNENGSNANVWVRRMTLAHELGHLLWDPDKRLNKLTVDDYRGLEAAFELRGRSASRPDPVEMRANAFAVAFLAPPAGIRTAVRVHRSDRDILNGVITRYGISVTAARHHVLNVTGHDVSHVSTRELSLPSDDWIARENLTVDYFPAKSTPISRRGRFAWLVAIAHRERRISSDTAATLLCTDAPWFEAIAATLIALGRP